MIRRDYRARRGAPHVTVVVVNLVLTFGGGNYEAEKQRRMAAR